MSLTGEELEAVEFFNIHHCWKEKCTGCDKVTAYVYVSDPHGLSVVCPDCWDKYMLEGYKKEKNNRT